MLHTYINWSIQSTIYVAISIYYNCCCCCEKGEREEILADTYLGNSWIKFPVTNLLCQEGWLGSQHNAIIHTIHTCRGW